MPLRPKVPNVGVEHGAWGEDVAVEYLRVHGYEIVDRNVRPCRRTGRPLTVTTPAESHTPLATMVRPFLFSVP